ncbi:hypothetical protein ACWFQ8_06910 [Streptomyces sp. NPDC055254]
MIALLTPAFDEIGDRINPFDSDNEHGLRLAVAEPTISGVAGWVVEGKSSAEVAPYPTKESEVRSWERQENAVPTAQSMSLFLQGGSAKRVVIEGLDIEARCRESLAGVYVRSPIGGGLPSRMFDIALDAPGGPTVEPLGKSGVESDEPETGSFPYTVTESELEHFLLEVRAENHACEWKGTLRWNVDGKRGSTKIDNNGGFFLVTAHNRATSTLDIERP